MTNTRSFAASEWWNPAAGMEAALRWNLMAVEWMTKGWRQWMELATALADPAMPEGAAGVRVARSGEAPESRRRGNDRRVAVRAGRTMEHAAARAASDRAAPKRPARPRAAASRARPRG